jgi:hypothetical protein
MKCNYNIKIFNAKMVLLLFLIFCIYWCTNGQGFQRVSQQGLECSYGLHHFTAKGREIKYSNFGPSSKGITLGYVVGNNLIKARLRGLGLYESTDNALTDYFQYEAETLLNFYPFEFLRTRTNIIDFYLFTGLNFNYIRFTNDRMGTMNFKSSNFNQVIGAGFEYIIRSGQKNVQLFSEISIGNNLAIEDEQHADVLPSLLTSINFGMRYCFEKQPKPRIF